MPFRVDPGRFIRGKERDLAVKALQRYAQRFTGSHFELFRSDDRPNEFTPDDFLAVSMLGVNVPGGAAIWLLGDGRDKVAELLRQLPPDIHIWDDVDLSKNGPLWSLSDLIRGNQWRDEDSANEIGPTISSKLLAAKRPHLVPIYDSRVVAAVMKPRSRDYWKSWRELLTGDDGIQLRSDVEELKAEALDEEPTFAAKLSVLRVLDIVIWMREWWRRRPPETLPDDIGGAEPFWVEGAPQR